jgi:hypothetical protein
LDRGSLFSSDCRRQRLYPAIRFDDGTWYREESSEMARTIAEGRLMDKAGS